MGSSPSRTKDAVVMASPVAFPSPDGHVFAPGDTICDRYKVIRFIAKGGMGEVYEVEDLRAKSQGRAENHSFVAGIIGENQQPLQAGNSASQKGDPSQRLPGL